MIAINVCLFLSEVMNRLNFQRKPKKVHFYFFVYLLDISGRSLDHCQVSVYSEGAIPTPASPCAVVTIRGEGWLMLQSGDQLTKNSHDQDILF